MGFIPFHICQGSFLLQGSLLGVVLRPPQERIQSGGCEPICIYLFTLFGLLDCLISQVSGFVMFC